MKPAICAVLFAVAFGSNILQAIAAGDNINGATINSPKYYAQVSQAIVSGECKQNTLIRGRGINESYEGTCLTGPLSFISTDEVLVIGDPTKDSYVLYSNVPASLKVIRDEECNRILYFISRRTGKILVKEIVMAVSECDKARKEIAAQLKNNKNLRMLNLKPGEFGGEEQQAASSEPTLEPNPWKSNVIGLDHSGARDRYFGVWAKISSDEEGMCKQQILIQGRGISDRFFGPCGDLHNPAVYINRNDPIIIVKRGRLTLFTDEVVPTLYVILDGKTCEQKLYYRNRFIVSSESIDITTEQCNNVKKRVESYITDAGIHEEQWDITGSDSQY